tara:strand:+ start:562 stop:756 length:195 start_codon:yes stop_codon:yes gene_type:complete
MQLGQLLVGSIYVNSGQQSTLQQALAEDAVIPDALATGRSVAARKAITIHVISCLATLAEDNSK